MSNLSVNEALKKAINAHKKGHIAEADIYYTAILKSNPKHPDANHNLAILAVGIGKANEAIPFFRNAISANPQNPQYWVSLIETYITLGKIEEAEKSLDTTLEMNLNHEKFDECRFKIDQISFAQDSCITTKNGLDASLRYFKSLYVKKEFELLHQYVEKALQSYSDSDELYNLCGAACINLSRFNEAIEHLNTSIKINSNSKETHNNIGIAYKSLGQFQNAYHAYQTALSIDPYYADALNNLGALQKYLGEYGHAYASFSKALEQNPTHLDALLNCADLLSEVQEFNAAKEYYTKAEKLLPNNPKIKLGRGNLLMKSGSIHKALSEYKVVAQETPRDPDIYTSMGYMYSLLGDYRNAKKNYRHAINLQPNSFQSHFNLSTINDYKIYTDHFDELKKLENSTTINPVDAHFLYFALAKACDEMGNYSEAFHYYVKANAYRRKILPYNIDADTSFFNQLKYQAKFITEQSLCLSKIRVRLTPIFIIGMPRSGTSLVEQILSNHSSVTGGGELTLVSRFGDHLFSDFSKINQKSISTFREQYLDGIQKIAGDKKFVTDKMPLNFRYVPLIKAALPEAIIINVNRYPPAVCWSNFKTNFMDCHVSMRFSNCLSDTVKYYIEYYKLMEVWKKYRNFQVIDFNYEQLVRDPGRSISWLANAINLDWEDALLRPEQNKRLVNTASEKEVKRKIYDGSSDRWKKYNEFLHPHIELLSTNGII